MPLLMSRTRSRGIIKSFGLESEVLSFKVDTCLLQKVGIPELTHSQSLRRPAVITTYCRSGGKSGVHVWHESIDSIGLLSYLVIQVYEQVLSLNQFRAVYQRVVSLQTFSYLHTPSDRFLRTLRLDFALHVAHSSPTLSPCSSFLCRLCMYFKLPFLVANMGQQCLETCSERLALCLTLIPI